MRIEPNDVNVMPYKKVITKTVGFQQYSVRPPINKTELKFNQPNDSRFDPHNTLPDQLTGTTYKQNLNMKKFRGRNLDEHLLEHIPQDMPVPGQYNHNSIDYTLKREDVKIPNLKMYTPKNLGKTATR